MTDFLVKLIINKVNKCFIHDLKKKKVWRYQIYVTWAERQLFTELHIESSKANNSIHALIPLLLVEIWSLIKL